MGLKEKNSTLLLKKLYLLAYNYGFLPAFKINTAATTKKIVEKIDPNLFTINQWIALVYFISVNGRVFLANMFRKKALDIVATSDLKDTKNKLKIMHLFNGYMEIGDYIKAEELIHKLKSSISRIF